MTGWNAIWSLRYAGYRGIIHNWSRGPLITGEWINYAKPLVLPGIARGRDKNVRGVDTTTLQNISVTKSLRNPARHGERSYLPTLETRNYRAPRSAAIYAALFTSRPNRWSSEEGTGRHQGNEGGDEKRTKGIAPWGLLTRKMTSWLRGYPEPAPFDTRLIHLHVSFFFRSSFLNHAI